MKQSSKGKHLKGILRKYNKSVINAYFSIFTYFTFSESLNRIPKKDSHSPR